MELLQLKYFQTVAKFEHITKAAKHLQIAQPSLSKTISRLEESLGVPLFDRDNRQIRLNEYGKAFLKRVENAFMELNEGQRELLDLVNKNENNLTLAVSIPRVLPELLQSFLLKYPDVRFQQFLESTSSMKTLLEEGKIDYCISSIPIEGSDIIWEPLMTEEIFLIVPPDHRFADSDRIRLNEAKDEPFISMHTGYSFRNLTDQFCREAGFLPYIAFEGDEPGVIGELVKQGLGIAFVPEITLFYQPERYPNKLHVIEPPCKRTIGLAWSKRRRSSEHFVQFRQFVIDYFSDISYRINEMKKDT